MDTKGNWPAYVLALRKDEFRETQTAFATRAFGKASQQAKVSRWEAGIGTPPDNAGDVAEFARKIGHNPLEAFVAAGMLNIKEAGRGLKPKERDLLKDLGLAGPIEFKQTTGQALEQPEETPVRPDDAPPS